MKLRPIKTYSFLMFCTLISGCGDECNKKYTFEGKVTESDSSPIEGVQVKLGVISTTTNSDGTYRYISHDPRSYYKGARINFIKSGYQVTASAPFTTSEAGPDACGDQILTRDVILIPKD